MAKDTELLRIIPKKIAQPRYPGPPGGRGRGLGPGRGLGIGGTLVCVCPKCGYEESHEKGEPCSKYVCPTCAHDRDIEVTLVGKGMPHGRGKGAGNKTAQDFAKMVEMNIDTVRELKDSGMSEMDIIEELAVGLRVSKQYAKEVYEEINEKLGSKKTGQGFEEFDIEPQKEKVIRKPILKTKVKEREEEKPKDKEPPKKPSIKELLEEEPEKPEAKGEVTPEEAASQIQMDPNAPQKLKDSVKTYFDSVGKIAEVDHKIKEMISDLENEKAGLTEDAAKAVKSVQGALEGMGDEITKGYETTKKINGSLVKIWLSTRETKKYSALYTTALSKLSKAAQDEMKKLEPALTNVSKALKLKKKSLFMSEGMRVLKGIDLKGIWEKIKGYISTAVEAAKGLTSALKDGLSDLESASKEASVEKKADDLIIEITSDEELEDELKGIERDILMCVNNVSKLEAGDLDGVMGGLKVCAKYLYTKTKFGKH